MNNKIFSIIVTIVSFLVIFIPSLQAAEITLAWDQPADECVVGYNIYYGVSGTEITTAPVLTIGSANQTSCLIPNLEEGQAYEFTATSVDAEGNESDFSETFYYLVEVTVTDLDGDGYTVDDGDLDDNDPSVYPGAIEICGDGIDQDCDGSDLACIDEVDIAMETGEVEVDHEWLFVAFDGVYANPVVVAKGVSLNGADPAVVRVKNVTAAGFEVRIQEWDYQNGSHAYETVNYIVMEEGRHELPGGIQVEAGFMDATGGKASVSFGQTFNQIPVVVSGVTTENEADAVTCRNFNISQDSFQFYLLEQEKTKFRHRATETISYIAWEPSSGTVNGMDYIVDSTFNEVTHNFYNIPFYPSFTSAPVLVADMQTVNGVDTCNLRWQNKTGNGIDIQVDEEQSKDSEVSHVGEAVGYMAFNSMN